MIRKVPVLIMVCVLAAASRASAGCLWFGTQLDCDLAASQVVIGTQAADEPTVSRSFWPRPFHGTDRRLDDRAASALPFALELQDIDADPSPFCRNIGNEADCY
jgi:hypothetical protein